MGIIEKMRLDGKKGFVTGAARGIGKSTAAAFAEVSACAALYDQKQEKICLAVAPETVELQKLYDYLREELPHYMLPGMIKATAAFSVTANGKTDRQAIMEELFHG